MTVENDETDTQGATAEGERQIRAGDVIQFPPIEVSGGSTPLSMRWEIEIAAGRDGERLSLQQAKVFQEIQAYLNSRRTDPEQGTKGAPPSE